MQNEQDPKAIDDVLAGVKRMREKYESLGHRENTLIMEDENSKDETNRQSSEKLNMRGTNVDRAQKAASRRADHPERSKKNTVQMYTAIQVSNSQKGNPLLTESMMKSVPWSFNSSILSDYYINPTLQILFLSLKYHKLHPEYIWLRLKKMNRGSSVSSTSRDRVLRILLVVVDVDSHQEILRKLLNFCVKHDLSLVLAWSFEEAGNYVVFAKQYELSNSKVMSAIRGLRDSSYQGSVTDTLTEIRAINKTDVLKLLANCGSFKDIVLEASKENIEESAINNIEGLGQRKAENLRTAFSQPFIYNKNYDAND